MNEDHASRPCLFCESAPAITWYGLCGRCALIKARRRIYRYGRGRSAEWEAHLLYLTERANQKLPLFVEGYVSPRRPQRGRRKGCEDHVPRVFRVTLPKKGREE
jgi:hypothetical protein